jgi:hypothetical protein
MPLAPGAPATDAAQFAIDGRPHFDNSSLSVADRHCVARSAKITSDAKKRRQLSFEQDASKGLQHLTEPKQSDDEEDIMDGFFPMPNKDDCPDPHIWNYFRANYRDRVNCMISEIDPHFVASLPPLGDYEVAIIKVKDVIVAAENRRFPFVESKQFVNYFDGTLHFGDPILAKVKKELVKFWLKRERMVARWEKEFVKYQQESYREKK